MQFFVLSAFGQQPAPSQNLLERTPFDQIKLNDAGNNETLEVMPLELPQRPLATKPTTGKLTVRLLERPAEEFEVLWAHVAELHVFEELLLNEAHRLTAAGQFDEAFDYFARLSAEYPKTPGLEKAINAYLRGNALALYQQGQHDHSLAVLLTLHQRSPNYAGLGVAVERVAGEVIERYLRDGDYAAARGVLDLWTAQFRGLAAPAAAEWQRRFEDAANRQSDEANRLIRNKDYIAARQSVAKALAIWPDLDAAASAAGQIQREFPFVTVGVSEAAPTTSQRRIDSWATLRAGRLTERLLAEQVGFGAEGGIYRSPFGELAVDDSGRLLTLALNSAAGAAGITSHGLARYLLAIAQPPSPHYRQDFTNLLTGVAISPPDTLEMQLTRIHVRPEALLQIPPPPSARRIGFAMADESSDQDVFAAIDAGLTEGTADPVRLQAIVEQKMPDDETAVAALLAGEVDVLDRVPPWHLARLHDAQGIAVERYRLPTVHVLIPNFDNPLMDKREFRRALCFGIDRKWIVQRVLLGGESAAGFEVLSGPFPAGTSLSDPVRYAYNNRIIPRPFEPRLAAILATVAWAAVQKAAEKDGEGADVDVPLPELTIAHPTDPVARLACQSIQAQLGRQGIAVKLKEFTADELIAGSIKYDLRYAELAVWEPVTDARLVLGPGSLTGDLQSAYLNAGLRKLDDATNWNDVRAQLAEIHEVAHHDLPVIPLWQTVNHFAYRTTIRGIGDSPVTLYQNIEEWAPVAPGNVAQLDQNNPQ